MEKNSLGHSFLDRSVCSVFLVRTCLEFHNLSVSTGADPGYKGTALQLVECGLALAQKKDLVGGVITPAAALGIDF